ncbi:MAG: MBL fold metallo-hydrolase [Parachlamydiaceae bacterium]|nr:MBL fold metallo-hydrolase [Parachlamydiaceae bacterium]
MKLIFLGSGSAFTVGDGNYQSNMLLESENGKRLLIDCGTDARFSLYELGFSYQDIQDVYISHLHADHVGGLEWLALNTKFEPSGEKVCLHLCKSVNYSLWDHVLSGGLSTITGDVKNLSYYFKIDEIQEDGSFTWEKIKFEIIRTKHVEAQEAQMPSYGLFFKINDQSIFITTDTQFDLDTLQPYYEKATIIFHDCETSERKSGVHATYEELKQLNEKTKQKMWLYHYHPGMLPDALADGFLGFVKKGQHFNF